MIKNHVEQLENIKANKYTVLCLLVTSCVNLFLWVLNVLNIFIIDANIFKIAVAGNLIVTFLTVALVMLLGFDSKYTKYILMFNAVVIYTILNATLTYHTILALIFPIIYSAQYRNKRLIWHTFGFCCIGTISAVVLGYRFGLCDANMVLLTSTTVSSFIDSFDSIQISSDIPYLQLILFFGFTRCMVLLAAVPIVYRLSTTLDETAIELHKKDKKNIEIQDNIVLSLASIINGRDKTTGSHVRNSSHYVRFIALKLRENGLFSDILTDEYIELLSKAAVLHDVGKLYVSDTVLCKTGKLTPEEYEDMKMHALYGSQIMKDIIGGIDDSQEYLEIASQMALSHHERWDGKGYPFGISGEDIPLCARIMAVGDVLDALLSARQYKDGFSYDKTYEIMSQEHNKQFDGRILEVVLNNWNDFKVYRDSMK